MAPYQPIACISHERLEFAVLRRLRLDLAWREGESTRHDTVSPLDVATRDGAEWLTCRLSDGGEAVIRLDHILSFEEIPLRR